MTILGVRDCDDFGGDVRADVAASPLPEDDSERARGRKARNKKKRRQRAQEEVKNLAGRVVTDRRIRGQDPTGSGVRAPP